MYVIIWILPPPPCAEGHCHTTIYMQMAKCAFMVGLVAPNFVFKKTCPFSTQHLDCLKKIDQNQSFAKPRMVTALSIISSIQRHVCTLSTNWPNQFILAEGDISVTETYYQVHHAQCKGERAVCHGQLCHQSQIQPPYYSERVRQLLPLQFRTPKMDDQFSTVSVYTHTQLSYYNLRHFQLIIQTDHVTHKATTC